MKSSGLASLVRLFSSQTFWPMTKLKLWHVTSFAHLIKHSGNSALQVSNVWPLRNIPPMDFPFVWQWEAAWNTPIRDTRSATENQNLGFILERILLPPFYERNKTVQNNTKVILLTLLYKQNSDASVCSSKTETKTCEHYNMVNWGLEARLEWPAFFRCKSGTNICHICFRIFFNFF